MSCRGLWQTAAEPFLPVRQACGSPGMCKFVMVTLGCSFSTFWEISRLLALPVFGNTEALTVSSCSYKGGNASSSVSLRLLSWKHRIGIWIEELSWFTLFFPLLAKLLQCLLFHSGARFCPGLVFGFNFPCVLAIWFLKASRSSFGFCCSCHLVHLQDKRKKLTGGLPPFHPYCNPSTGHFFEHKNLPSA